MHKSALWEWDKHPKMLLKNMVFLESFKTKWHLSHIKKLLIQIKWDGHNRRLPHTPLKYWTKMEMRKKSLLTEMMVLDHKLPWLVLQN